MVTGKSDPSLKSAGINSLHGHSSGANLDSPERPLEDWVRAVYADPVEMARLELCEHLRSMRRLESEALWQSM